MAGCNMFLELSGVKTRYNEARAALFKTRSSSPSKVDEDEVPASVMITHREASVQLNTSRKMCSDDDESESKQGEGGQPSAAQEEKLLEALPSVKSNAGVAGQPAHSYQSTAEAGRGWPRLELALSLIGCWRALLRSHSCGLWAAVATQVLLPLQAEAEFLLRRPLSSAAALQQARDRVASALAFEQRQP